MVSNDSSSSFCLLAPGSVSRSDCERLEPLGCPLPTSDCDSENVIHEAAQVNDRPGQVQCGLEQLTFISCLSLGNLR